MKSGLAQSLSERSPKKGNHFQKAVSPLPKFASSWGHSLPACRLPHNFNSAALCVLLLPGHRPHQVRNHSHRTLGIAVHRPCLFRRHHHRCSLDRFSCAPHGDATTPRDYHSMVLFRQRDSRNIRGGIASYSLCVPHTQTHPVARYGAAPPAKQGCAEVRFEAYRSRPWWKRINAAPPGRH
jgi:hypothetical protein